MRVFGLEEVPYENVYAYKVYEEVKVGKYTRLRILRCLAEIRQDDSASSF